MWCYRKVMRLSWLKKISNERVVYMVGLERSLLVIMRRRKLRFVGHVVRKGGLEKLVLEGKINGKRQKGRLRLKYLGGLALTAGCGALDILRRADDRSGFKYMIANIKP